MKLVHGNSKAGSTLLELLLLYPRPSFESLTLQFQIFYRQDVVSENRMNAKMF